MTSAPTQAPLRQSPVPGFALTLFALILTLLAYALAGIGKDGAVPANLGLYGTLVALEFFGVFLFMRKAAPHADPALFPMAAALSGIGFAVIYRLDGDLAAEQFTWLAMGLVAFLVTLAVVRDHRMLDAFTYTIGLIGIVLLLLPVLPAIGQEINGARLWVRLGPVQFQPAELGKVFIVVFLASYLSRKRELLSTTAWRLGPIGMPAARHLGPLLGAWGLSLIVLFAEKDLGASLLFFTVFVVMLWMATGRIAYPLIGLVLFAAGAWFAYQAFDHVQLRVDVWLNALDPAKIYEQGYGQVANGQFALASGGLFGTGLGEGMPFLIPGDNAGATDFIFAAIGEELGLVGTVGVLMLLLGVVGKGFSTAVHAKDEFGKLLASGLAVLLGVQVFVIVAGVTRLIPLTGITLPFVSYGGSSLVANFIILALIVRVSSGPAPGSRR